MKALKIYLMFSLLFLSACASTHPGLEAQVLKSDTSITLSAQSVDVRENDAFQLIEVTLENVSDGWVRIEKADVIINPNITDKVSVVVGDDLKSWANAMKFRLNKEQHNAALGQIALVAAGSVAAAASGNSNSNTADTAAAVGAAAVLGGYAWATVDTIKAVYRNVEGVDSTPENHLYAKMSIPPKMFIRRWVLLNKPSNGYVNKVIIKVKTVEGTEGLYAINL